ncbi:MAG: type II toxin-antitoxin system MqsA family antitoxin [Syntrophomonadaceae bacterium]|nr:type II toxin-antitoxin system MqsA family antitoxin [Syntrophomonadaceae bacterium]
MNCIMCKANMTEGKVNHIVDIDGCIVIIKNVPANVCGQCGEYFINNVTALRLEEIVGEVAKSKAEILVLNYVELVA